MIPSFRLEVDMKKSNRLMALAIAALLITSTNVSAPGAKRSAEAKAAHHVDQPGQDQKARHGERLEPDDSRRAPSDVPDEMQANRQEQLSEEEAAINPYYNNFFSTYRLGPEDVISVEVFNQERYSRKGITVPPSGRISLPLIPGGIFVNGKTVEEVARAHQEAIRRVHHRSAGYCLARQSVFVSLQRHWRRGPAGHSVDESPHDRY